MDAELNTLKKRIAYQNAEDQNPTEEKLGEDNRKYGL